MDVFDGEPYLGLVPRRWVKPFAFALLVAMWLVPGVRQWWIDQAQQHVVHELEPFLAELLDPAVPTGNTEHGPASPARPGRG